MKERMTPILQQLEVLKEENNSLCDALQEANDKYRARKKQMQKVSQLADAELKEKCDTLGHFKCSYEKAMKELDQCRSEIEARDKKVCPVYSRHRPISHTLADQIVEDQIKGCCAPAETTEIK
jgi:predicted nuclease with TOPRIM domain